MEFDIRHLYQVGPYSLYHVDEIDSTNTYFKNNFEFYLDNSVLQADYQSAGRGRYIRKWENDEDLCFSILTYQRERYEILTPLSVMNVLRKHHIKAFIKWPNDVYISNKKVCGILIEDIYQASMFKACIIGIGINMTNKDEVNGIGLYSFQLKDKMMLLEEVLEELSLLKERPFEEIIQEYTKNNLIYNRLIEFEGETLKVVSFSKEGYIIAVDNQGNNRIIKSDEINIKQSLKDDTWKNI